MNFLNTRKKKYNENKEESIKQVKEYYKENKTKVLEYKFHYYYKNKGVAKSLGHLEKVFYKFIFALVMN